MHIMCAFLYTLLFKKGIKLVSLAVWTAPCSAVIMSIIYRAATLCCNALYNVLYCTAPTLTVSPSPGNLFGETLEVV